jgi:ribosomal protein L10
MTNKKKKIHKIKTENFLKEFPIIFLLQHNNFSIQDWFDFRKQLQDLKNSQSIKGYLHDNSQKDYQKNFFKDMEILHIKNTLASLVLKNTDSLETLQFLCQGPNFLIGCKTQNNFNGIWNFLNANSKVIFISCIFHGKLLNHLDIETLLKTDQAIYSQLLNTLDKKTELFIRLQETLQIYSLMSSIPFQFLHSLNSFQYSLRQKNSKF